MKFRVRIDESNEGLIGVHLRQVLVDYVKSVDHVLVHHVLPHGNPHFHIFVDMPQYKSKEAFKYQFKKQFKTATADSRNFSIKQCNDDRVDEYIQYLFNRKHGNKWTLIASSRDTTEHQRLADNVFKEYVTQTAERVAKKQGPSVWELGMELRSAIERETQELSDRDRQDFILAEVIRIHEGHKKAYCDYSLQKVIDTAIGGTRYGYYLTQRMRRRLFWDE